MRSNLIYHNYVRLRSVAHEVYELILLLYSVSGKDNLVNATHSHKRWSILKSVFPGKPPILMPDLKKSQPSLNKFLIKNIVLKS